MIEQTSFLGLPLRRQAQRLLVVLYYGVLALFAMAAVIDTPRHGIRGYLIPQVAAV